MSMHSPSSLSPDESTLTDASSRNIRVYCRIRPPNEREESSGYQSCVTRTAPNTLEIAAVRGSQEGNKIFTFDHVADQHSTQDDVFMKVGKAITDTCLQGINGTIFAYGQTGSGKTFTIQGVHDTSNPVLRGLMPRVFEYITGSIARMKRLKPTLQFQLKASFLEIYNDDVYDLLRPQNPALAIREDTDRGAYVENLFEQRVETAAECLEVMQKGVANRRIGETAMNRESSRSHCCFALSIYSREVDASGIVTEKHSRFNLVDLAGSERQKDTATTGQRLREATKINKSLSALGNVIRALVDTARTGVRRHVHYRDSPLTFLLKDSLGGNSLTYIVACISPAVANYGETLSTLKFAQRAKHIKNNAVINEDRSETTASLKEEIARLTALNAQLQASVSVPRSTFLTPRKSSPSSSTDPTSLDTLLTASLTREEMWRTRVSLLEAKCATWEQLNERKEKKELSTGMMLQLRENTIKMLEQRVRGLPTSSDDELNLLRQERDLLKTQLQYHPEVVQKQMMIIEMEDRLALLEKELAAARPDTTIDTKTTNATLTNQLTQNVTLTQEIMNLRKQITEKQNEMGVLQQQLRSPGKLLQAMATPARRKFELMELETWKQEKAFESQIKAVRDELSRETARRSELENELKQQQTHYTTEIHTLQRQLEESHATHEAAMIRFDTEKRRLVEKSESELQAIKSAYEQQLNQFRAGAEASERSSVEVAQLQAQLEIARSDATTAHTQIANLDTSIVTLRATLEQEIRMHTQLRSDMDVERKRMEQEMATLRSAVSTAEEGMKLAKERCESLIQEMSEMRSSHTLAIQTLREQHASHTSEHSTRQINLEQLLECKQAEVDRLSFQVENLQEDHNDLMEDFRFKQSLYEEATAKQAAMQKQLDTLNMQLGQHQQRYIELEETNMRLREQLHNVTEQQSINDVQQMMMEKTQLELSLSAAHTATQVVATQLQETQQQRDEAMTTITNMKKHEVELMMELNEIRTAFKELQTAYDTNQHTWSATTTELTTVTSQLEEMRTTVEMITTQAQTAEETVKEQQVEMEQLQNKYSADLRELMGELTRQQTLLEDRQTSITTLHKQMDELTQQLADMTSHMDEERTRVASQHGVVVQALQKQVETLKHEMETQAENYKEQLYLLQQSYESIVTERDHLQHSLSLTNTELESLRPTNAELERRILLINSLLNEIRSGPSTSTSPSTDILPDDVTSTIKGIESRYIEVCQQRDAEHVQHQHELEEWKQQVTSWEEKYTSLEKEMESMQTRITAESEHAHMEHQQQETLAQELAHMKQLLDEKEDTFTRLSSSWERIQKEKDDIIHTTQESLTQANIRITMLTTQVTQLETELATKTSQYNQLHHQMTTREAETSDLLESQVKEIEQHLEENIKMQQELGQLRTALRTSLLDKQSYLDEMDRYRQEEERTATLYTQICHDMNQMKEEYTKMEMKIKELQSFNDKLTEQNAKLIGHQNPKQKIQHHMKIKQENDQLKAEKHQLEVALKTLQKQHGIVANVKSGGNKENMNGEEEEDEETLRIQLKSLREQEKSTAQLLSQFVSQLQQVVPKPGNVEPIVLESDKKRSDDDLDLDSLDLDTPHHTRTTSQDAHHTTLTQSMEMLKQLCNMWKDSQSTLSQRTAQLSQRDKQIALLTKQAALQKEQIAITMMNAMDVSHVSRRQPTAIKSESRTDDQFTEATTFFATPAKSKSTSQFLSP